MTRHAYLPRLIITDNGSISVLEVIHGVAEILGIILKHATTKRAQTIGVLERAMPQSRFLLNWHHANIGNNGTSIYPLQS